MERTGIIIAEINRKLSIAVMGARKRAKELINEVINEDLPKLKQTIDEVRK